MELPLAIHKDQDSVYGVSIPDVPGCYSWGDSIDEAIKNAKVAVHGHFEAIIEQGDTLELKASRIEDLAKNEDFAGAIWAFVDINLSKIDAKPERINISLPRFF